MEVSPPRHKATRGLRKPKGKGMSRIPNRVSIHDRPQTVASEFGHWEGDLMAFLKNSKHILVLRERKTMFTKAAPLETKKALTTAQKIIDLMKKIPSAARKSMTFDNGLEFAGHETCSKHLKMQAFFCDPYASWQKGGVENTNGRLRRDLPRNTNIHTLSKEDFYETTGCILKISYLIVFSYFLKTPLRQINRRSFSSAVMKV